MLLKCRCVGVHGEVSVDISFDVLAFMYVLCLIKTICLLIFKRTDPGSGNLVTFAQFLFIALEGFIFTSKFGTEPLRIGYSSYALLVVMFFVASVFNNYAFDFNIPMPLHMIFRAVSDKISGFALANSQIVQLKWIFTRFSGLVNCKHDNGYYHTKKTLRIIQIRVGDNDFAWHCYLHICIWHWSCKCSIFCFVYFWILF